EVQVKIFDLAGPIAAQANLGAGAERPAGLCRMAGEWGADRVDAGGGEGDADGARGVVVVFVIFIVIVILVAVVAFPCGDVFHRDRGASLRDALSDREARAADGAGSLNPADGETPRCIDHNVRRESSAKTRA